MLIDFDSIATELTTQKYSTNLGTFSLSCVLLDFLMQCLISGDPLGVDDDVVVVLAPELVVREEKATELLD